jgi:putative transposase
VDRDAYLLALCRYVERNPVAAGIVAQPQDWPWSSCRAHLGLEGTPPWLDTDGLHGYLLAREPKTSKDQQHAARLYAKMVTQTDPADDAFWATALRQQIFLGDKAFAQRMQEKADPLRRAAADVPRPQRQSVADTPAARERVWGECLQRCSGDRAAALHAAYREHGMTMTALASLAGLSVSRVSRLIAGEEARDAAAGQQLRTDACTGLPVIRSARPITAEDVRALEDE